MKREKDLLKNIIILFVGTVFPKIVHFITLPILTAYLSKENYGYYDLITTAVAFFVPVVTLQIQSAAFRYIIEYRDNEEEKKGVVTNVFVFVCVSSLILLSVLYIALNKFSVLIRFLICVYFFVDTLITVTRQVVRGLGKNKVYANSVVTESFIYFIAVVLFLFAFRMELEGALISITLALLASEVYLIKKAQLIGYIRIHKIDKGVLGVLIKYAIPMVPGVLSHWMIQMSDRFVITMFLGVEANAIYAISSKLPNLYNTMQKTFTLAWQENASLSSNDDDADAYYSKMFDTIYCVFFGLISLLIAVTPILFKILVKGNYDEAYYQIPILYIATFLSSINAYLGGIYVAHKQTKKIGITTMVVAACNLIIDLLLVNKIGIYAGSISTLISYMIFVGYRMIDVQNFQRMHFNIKKMSTMLGLLAIMAVFMYKNNFYFNVINVILAVALSFIFNKKNIKDVLSMVTKKNK